MNRLLLLVTLASAALLVFGLWIPAKAVLAQELLELAWAQSQAGRGEVRPWPWADTWPVAKLDLPELDESMIVLAGSHGESLAFGPGAMTDRVDGSEPVVIAGHRDTHFRKLQYLETGSAIRIQDRQGQWHGYQVTGVRVVDSRSEGIDVAGMSPDSLLLVTCYPFDSVNAGGPLRYVVEARAQALHKNNPIGRIDTVAGT